ncbi:MAG: GTP 3',8-cyclase MoaA [Clostridiaceae bacterium]
MFDSKGREINYLRVSLTDRCNLRCIYCMPEKGIVKKTHDDILRFEDTLKILRASALLGIKKIRFTGGEPLIVKGIDKLIYETSRIQGIDDIAITTNAILLDDMAGELKEAGLKRVNISLDTLNAEKFKKITRGGGIEKVFKAIDKCLNLGIKPVKINTVMIKGINDDEIKDLIYLTKKLPVNIRFIELMPIGEGLEYYKEGFISAEDFICGFPELVPLSNTASSTAKLYKLPNSKGSVGFISPLSCKFCNSCNRIRLTASGTIKPCLHSEEESDLTKELNNEIRLLAELKRIIFNKPSQHNLNSEGMSESKRKMYEIGG